MSFSKETILKMRLAKLGKKRGPHTLQTRLKMSAIASGKPKSETHRINIKLAKLKKPTKYWLGKKRPDMAGPNSFKWIADRTQIKQYWTERNNPEYKQWRQQVWLRDNFTCKIANPDCKGRIEAHHILGWKDHPELRYQLNNGITLCHAHHPRKRAEEKRLSPFFMDLVSVSK